jgi:FlaA1/EpsC-like NDP-sugar epimerase
LIDGQSVLITGGTGSFGSACVKRLLNRHDPKRVIVFSRDEHKQARMADEFKDGRLRLFIGDVRDRDRLRRAFDGVDIVVHAAALKRIEVGQYNPGEMVKTNVLGAMNIIEAAQDAGVSKVVALSTDKAWQPISPYGQTKALAESLFLNANNTRGANGPIFACTRYGNVAGSNGSVIPKWRAMNGSVPVTDPDCTRFYMTMDQALDLVLKTIETMKGGELNIPKLPAYRLGDLAYAMDKAIKLTGLPAYEKMHEGMADGNTSDVARRMSVDELRNALQSV